MICRNAVIAGLLGAVLSTSTAAADPLDLPISGLLSLAERAFSSRDGFEIALLTQLPSAVVTSEGRTASPQDPFLWSMGGRFGGAGASPRPGAIFGCARYGLGTLALFDAHGFAAPETFALMGDVLPLSDDAELWPEAAVARLHCIFIWDDAETVRIIPEPVARQALSLAFEEVTTDPDSTLFASLLGPDGFRLFGQNGPGDSVVWVESGDVILTNGHQQVSFRAFLIGGAV